jgi:cyclopropane-fatty-acyl-phospholipid synthase
MTTQSALVTAPIPFKASMFIKMLERLDCGRLNLTLPNEETLVFRGKQTGIEAHLHIKNWAAVNKVLQSGDIGVSNSQFDFSPCFWSCRRDRFKAL